jgi:phosphoribosylanthranilate isomerase
MFVKVCGITEKKQIDWAIELDYSAVGFVVYPKSKRFVDGKNLDSLLEYATNKINTVVVSVNFTDVARFAENADFIQYYTLDSIIGEKYCHKTIIAGKYIPKNLNYKYFLYDESHGSGRFKSFPKDIIDIADKLILAGGLSPDNIAEIIKSINPFGVDVSSGVEIEPGKKNYQLMKKFISNIKEVKND